jgi:hypothetical protein
MMNYGRHADGQSVRWLLGPPMGSVSESENLPSFVRDVRPAQSRLYLREAACNWGAGFFAECVSRNLAQAARRSDREPPPPK